MHTMGYRARPWREGLRFASGQAILDYVRAAAAEHGVADHIRFGYRVTAAAWSSADARWTVTAEHGAERRTVTCRVLHLCTGYYDFARGHEVTWPGQDSFTGRIVHPQCWPADLDVTGLRVVVVGSGATAVTLVPALAERAAHVTMLQRSPSYLIPLPSHDPLAGRLAELVGARAAHVLIRWQNILASTGFYRLSRRRPDLVRRWLLRRVGRALPPGYDVGTHFTPRYAPWDQRVCVVPDGDLFAAVSSGRAEVVTAAIAGLSADGIRLDGGAILPADVIVTATGLRLLPLGGIDLEVDGVPVRLPDTVSYKAMMLGGVPNLVFTIGYANTSWTLKADLVVDMLCRVLTHLDASGADTFTPAEPEPGMATRPLIDLSAGYIRRGRDAMPRAGSSPPWRLGTHYLEDLRALRYGRLSDGVLRFGHRPGRQAPPEGRERRPAPGA